MTRVMCIILEGQVRYAGTTSIFGHIIANSEDPDETSYKEPSHLDYHCVVVCCVKAIILKFKFICCPNSLNFTLL